MKLEDLFCLPGGRPRITVKDFLTQRKRGFLERTRIRESVSEAQQAKALVEQESFQEEHATRTHPR